MLTPVKKALRESMNRLGYEVRKVDRPPIPAARSGPAGPPPPPVEPVWPLPRRAGGPGDREIREAFSRHRLWHYAYRFEGGLSFEARHEHTSDRGLSDAPERPLQRFRHFMPYVVASQGGSLRGKRVLDIACNSGFWSTQCALLGAEVVGFDAREVLIEQANLIKSIVGLENVTYRVLDFWSMSPEALGGTFDVVLNLGVLYHLPEPIEALRITRAMARDAIVLDTMVCNAPEPIVSLKWEEPEDIRDASKRGIVAYPTKKALEMVFRHLGMREWSEVPIRTRDMPQDYIDGDRASWILRP